MLQPYLHKYADFVDLQNYRVRFRNDLDRAAHQAFEDGDYFSVSWFAEFWRQFFRGKLQSAGLRIAPSSLVLDSCCGQGYLGELIEKEFCVRVVYCDLSQRQLQRLRTRLMGVSAKRPAVCAANLACLPYPSERFDAVVGNSFLHHVPDVPRVLAELRRQLKPGGQLVLFHEPTTTSTFWESFPLSLLKDTTLIDGGFTDLWMFAPDDAARLVREAGFSQVRVFTSGIFSALFLNWYLLLAIKLNWRSRWGVYPAYRLRAWLNQLDMAFQNNLKTRLSPSVMVMARK